MLGGHALGLACGYGSLVAFQLTDAGAATMVGVDAARIGAAALSLSATAGTMLLCRCLHPPAGATTLIVSLGIIRAPVDVAVMMAAIATLYAILVALQRLLRLSLPRSE